MKKHFWIVIFCALVSMNNSSFAQDTIKTKSGEVIKARLLKLTRKEATYKTYNDPEFSTYTLPYKELSSIQREGDKKVVLFNHKLPRGFICYSMSPPGLSMGVGSFGKSIPSKSKNEPGFAGEGTGFRFDAGFYIWRKLGITINMGYSLHKFEYDEYWDLYGGSAAFSNPSYFVTNKYYDPNFPPTEKDKLRDTRWTFKQLMIGPMYSFKLGKRITQDLKARIGFVETSKPPLYVGFTYYDGPNIISSSTAFYESNKTDFSYGFGSSTRVALSKRIALYLAADFLHTSPDLDINSTQTNSGGTIDSPSSKVHYEISTLNFSLGFAYQFKRKGNKYE